MADRSLRGSRLGSQNFQSEDGVEFAGRLIARYRAEDGSEFDVTFADDAEIPATWESARTGQFGHLLGDDGNLVESGEDEVKPARTHWDMLLERRTEAELEEILQERLAVLRSHRSENARKSA